ncbi:MAG TPA: DEAD/DEAH box helicase family protein [Bacteroidaceae bacterium]|nr:DEAD/DEAH box helicase family protein [Bacteroidaceae bacterium]
MSETQTKQFQYEIQDFQEDCVNNIITIFESLRQNVNFNEVLAKHHDKNNYNFPVKDTRNIDVMMETGTGKTFTFIKTIFELNKNFGYKKFVILIPSIPIREGTKSNLDDTKDYFKSYYANEREKEIEAFTYEGGNISAVRQFIGTSHLSVLIMTPSSFSHKDNILNRPLESELNSPDLFTTSEKPIKSYLDALKRLNPIVIMDEPHRFEGDAFKKYFKGFENYYLRFGATFPKKKNSLPLSNVAYVLDSISSFRQSLVKKIVVYTQDVVENTDTLIGIEKEGSKNIAIVNTLSNGIVTEKKLSVGTVFNGKSIKKILKETLVLDDDTIERVEYSISDESLRAMIRETIKIHFEKEKILHEQGIKTLTLFFMKSDTSLFRGDNPKIRTIFEEEYIIQQKEVVKLLDKTSDYYKYLKNDFDSNNHLQVHKGYFSGDKGNADEKIKAGVDEILKDKKKLLSFKSPTRFIFSIWALQEGWDNPNVFTICKLSNQGSEISKLQQIGRGLRICVNQDLQRNTLNHLDDNQEEFWRINNLDVVVSGKEQGFVEAIQNEILSNSFLIAEIFTEQELKKLLKEKGGFDDRTVRNIYRMLENKEMIIFKATVDGIDVFDKSPDFAKILKEQNLPEEQKKVIESLFAFDANTYVQRAEKKKDKKKVFIKSAHLKEFQKLWNTISKNAFYVLDTLTVEQEKQLIQNIKTQVEEEVNIDEILLQTIRAELNVEKIGEQGAITEKLIDTVSHKSKVDYLGLVQSLSNKTKTPLSFVVKVFNSLSDHFKNKMLCNNPEQAQREIAEIINRNLVAMLKANIHYDGMSGKVMPNVFKSENGKTYLDIGSTGKFQKDIEGDFSLRPKWVFEEVIEYDSDFELGIVEQDPDIDSIEVFGKLPRLKIKTPLGDYNPDFCYAIKSSDGNKVILVVEAKGYDSSTKIPTSEKGKIEFAKKYFEALNENYKNEKIKVSFKERINRTQLAALINNL